MGFLLGLAFAMVVGPLRGFHQITREHDLAVALSISTLEKLATNDVPGAQARLSRFVASSYLAHKTMTGSWFVRMTSLSPELVRRVEKVAEHLPELHQAIKEEQEERSTNHTSEDIVAKRAESSR